LYVFRFQLNANAAVKNGSGALALVIPEQDVVATFTHHCYLRQRQRKVHEDVRVILNEKQR